MWRHKKWHTFVECLLFGSLASDWVRCHSLVPLGHDTAVGSSSLHIWETSHCRWCHLRRSKWLRMLHACWWTCKGLSVRSIRKARSHISIGRRLRMRWVRSLDLAITPCVWGRELWLHHLSCSRIRQRQGWHADILLFADHRVVGSLCAALYRKIYRQTVFLVLIWRCKHARHLSIAI